VMFRFKRPPLLEQETTREDSLVEETPVEAADTAKPLRLFMIAGEESGDMHASNLVKAITHLYPQTRITGLGGKRMEKAGVRLMRNIVEHLAIMGFIPVLLNIREISELLNSCDRFLRDKQPDGVILVDYPGFNLRIAEKAKKYGIPVIWYISPQIWAWKYNRLYKLAKFVKRMMVVFPFEVPLYKQENVDVVHVGHPLFDVIEVTKSREEICEEFGLDAERPIITMIPGSRENEVKSFLPILLQGAQRYNEMDSQAQFVIIRASTIPEFIIQQYVKRYAPTMNIRIVDKYRYDMRVAGDFSWVKSGTSTLEAAILGTPMVIVYRVNALTWIIGKQIFTIGFIGLPNIVAGDRIVPELLQDEFTPLNLAEKTHRYLSRPELYQDMVNDLELVKAKLQGRDESEGGKQVAMKAAEAVLQTLGRKPQRKPVSLDLREY
jgi:lipid-A-disaccharide synthase